RAVLKVLRHEWEMASIDLRKESGVSDRTAFTRALDELQAADRDPERGGLPAEVHVPLDARGEPVSRRSDAARRSRRRAVRDRARISQRRRRDDTRRARARCWIVAARSR